LYSNVIVVCEYLSVGGLWLGCNSIIYAKPVLLSGDILVLGLWLVVVSLFWNITVKPTRKLAVCVILVNSGERVGVVGAGGGGR